MIRRALCALSLLLAGPAGARVLDGQIVAQDGAGRFVLLDELPLAVGEDRFDDPNLYAFDEAQAVLLEVPLTLELGAPIPAGTVVALHHVLFDGTGGRQRGTVLFDTAILGVATGATSLAATDALAGVDILYIDTPLRGLEDGDRVWIDAGNPRRLWLDWAGSSPGDHIRVVTDVPPMM
jgi:hypothetical protein